MVRIFRTDRQTEVGPRELIAPDFAAVSESLARTSLAAAEVQERYRKIQEDTEVSETLSVMEQRIKTKQQELASVTNPGEYEFEMGLFIDEQRDLALENASTPRVRGLLNVDVMNRTEAAQMEVGKRVREITVSEGQARVDRDLQAAARNASLATSDVMRQYWIGVGGEAVNNGLATGLYLGEEANKRREKFLGDIDEYQIQQRAAQDLDGTRASLDDPNQYQHINLDTRRQWGRALDERIQTRNRRQEADWERREREAERANKEREKRHFMQVVVPMTQQGVQKTDANGQPEFTSDGRPVMRRANIADLQAQEPYLGEEQLKAGLNLLRQDVIVQNDPASERLLANVTTPEEGMRLLNQEYGANHIDTPTFRFYLNRFTAMGNQPVSQDPAMRGIKYIQDALALTEAERRFGLLSGGKNQAVDRVESGTREFRGWYQERVDAGDPPTQVEINKMTDEIVKRRRQSVSLAQTGQKIPAPKNVKMSADVFLQVPPEKGKAQLQQAMAELKAQKDRGEIGEVRYVEEMKIIAGWLDYFGAIEADQALSSKGPAAEAPIPEVP